MALITQVNGRIVSHTGMVYYLIPKMMNNTMVVGKTTKGKDLASKLGLIMKHIQEVGKTIKGMVMAYKRGLMAPITKGIG
jgi:hypothetical protein